MNRSEERRKRDQEGSEPRVKSRTALYLWRMLKQLPWLVLRYKL